MFFFEISGQESRRKFAAQDTFVSWHLQPRFIPASSLSEESSSSLSLSSSSSAAAQSSATSSATTSGQRVVQRAQLNQLNQLSQLAAGLQSVQQQALVSMDEARGTVCLQRYCHVFAEVTPPCVALKVNVVCG